MGVLAIGLVFASLFAMPFIGLGGGKFRIITEWFYWTFLADVLLLTWLGGQEITPITSFMGQCCTAYLFFYLLICQPLVGFFEAQLAGKALPVSLSSTSKRYYTTSINPNNFFEAYLAFLRWFLAPGYWLGARSTWGYFPWLFLFSFVVGTLSRLFTLLSLEMQWDTLLGDLVYAYGFSCFIVSLITKIKQLLATRKHSFTFTNGFSKFGVGKRFFSTMTAMAEVSREVPYYGVLLYACLAFLLWKYGNSSPDLAFDPLVLVSKVGNLLVLGVPQLDAVVAEKAALYQGYLHYQEALAEALQAWESRNPAARFFSNLFRGGNAKTLFVKAYILQWFVANNLEYCHSFSTLSGEELQLAQMAAAMKVQYERDALAMAGIAVTWASMVRVVAETFGLVPHPDFPGRLIVLHNLMLMLNTTGHYQMPFFAVDLLSHDLAVHFGHTGVAPAVPAVPVVIDPMPVIDTGVQPVAAPQPAPVPDPAPAPHPAPAPQVPPSGPGLPLPGPGNVRVGSGASVSPDNTPPAYFDANNFRD